MGNKTCGECRFFESKEFICCSSGDEVAEHFIACYNFEPMAKPKPTNGDKIRQDENHDFAEYFVYEIGAMFATTLIVDKTFDTYEEAVEATEDYLNAPAEREE